MLTDAKLRNPKPEDKLYSVKTETALTGGYTGRNNLFWAQPLINQFWIVDP